MPGEKTPLGWITNVGIGIGFGAIAAGIGPAVASVVNAGRIAIPSSTTATINAARSAATNATSQSVGSILPTPQVQTPRLQNIVDNLYKGTTNPEKVGNGTTMDAVVSERTTGVPTQGVNHTIKAQDSINGLQNFLLKNPGAPYDDRLVAQSLLDELREAMGQ